MKRCCNSLSRWPRPPATDQGPGPGPGPGPGCCGFTLIEILVVLAIFSVLGLVSHELLSRTLHNQETLSARTDRLAEIHRAMTILQRDLMQAIDRPVRDGLGDPMPSVQIGADGAIVFTRTGWRNPLVAPRAELQRVGYRLQDEALQRFWWPVLDRAEDSEALEQTLLEAVTQAEFLALDANGDEHAFWPTAEDAETNPPLAGIILRLDCSPFGVLERIWPVPPQ